MLDKHIYKGVPLDNVNYIISSQRDAALFVSIGGVIMNEFEEKLYKEVKNEKFLITNIAKKDYGFKIDLKGKEKVIGYYYLDKDVIDTIFSKRDIKLSPEQIHSIYNENIIIKLLEIDIDNYKYIDVSVINEMQNKEQELYQLFKNSGMTDPYIHPLFANCNLIVSEYGNHTVGISKELLEFYDRRAYSTESLVFLSSSL